MSFAPTDVVNGPEADDIEIVGLLGKWTSVVAEGEVESAVGTMISFPTKHVDVDVHRGAVTTVAIAITARIAWRFLVSGPAIATP
jgi:hypothetical protein